MIFELLTLSFIKVLKWQKHTCSDIVSQPVGRLELLSPRNSVTQAVLMQDFQR